MSRPRPGCCVDGSCHPNFVGEDAETESDCMRLPLGVYCGDCVHFGRCSAMFGKPYTVERVAEYWKDRAEAAELRATISDVEIDRLSAVRDQNERLRITLANTVMAMRLWGAEEDGVPGDGPIGAAFDAANVVLKEGIR